MQKIQSIHKKRRKYSVNKIKDNNIAIRQN